MMIRGTKKDLLSELRYLAECTNRAHDNALNGYHGDSMMLLKAIEHKLHHIADSVESGELGRLQDYPTK